MYVRVTLKNYRCFPDNEPARFDLRPGITAFVGVNNSGKSALIRWAYELRHVFRIVSSAGPFLFNYLRSPTLYPFQFPAPIRDQTEVFSNRNDRPLEIILDSVVESNDPSPVEWKTPSRLSVTISREPGLRGATTDAESYRLIAEAREIRPDGDLWRMDTGVLDWTPYHAAFRSVIGSVYIGAFRNALNVGGTQAYYDIEVGQRFIEAWRVYKSGPTKRDNEAAVALAEDVRRLCSFDRLEINPSHDDQTLQINIDGKSYKLNEVGSGIAQLIIVLATAATRRPSYVLIDEPELNLHPSLQLDFITTLASYAADGVFLATHSLGLARAGADRVYALHRVGAGESAVRAYEEGVRLGEFLGAMNFSRHRDLGFDRVLLVEGATDIKALQQLLRLVHKDHEVVVLPLGGSAMINGDREVELAEVLRISPRVFALIDSERNAEDGELSPARTAFRTSCVNLGIECVVLKRRAIENYFTDAAVKGAMGASYRALEPFELLGSDVPGWSKADNWRIARQMGIGDLAGTDLGAFVERM